MGLIRAVGVSVMGLRQHASVVRQGMRFSTRLVPVLADRKGLRQYFWSMKALEADAEFFTPDFVSG